MLVSILCCIIIVSDRRSDLRASPLSFHFIFHFVFLPPPPPPPNPSIANSRTFIIRSLLFFSLPISKSPLSLSDSLLFAWCFLARFGPCMCVCVHLPYLLFPQFLPFFFTHSFGYFWYLSFYPPLFSFSHFSLCRSLSVCIGFKKLVFVWCVLNTQKSKNHTNSKLYRVIIARSRSCVLTDSFCQISVCMCAA